MKYLLTVISLTLFFSFLGGLVGSLVYNKATEKQVLGTTTAAPAQVEENIRADHNNISVTYPKHYNIEKVVSKEAEYLKLTHDNKTIIVEKDISTLKQIEKDLGCLNKKECKKISHGANTYTNIKTEEADVYMTAKDNEFVVIKFVNVDKDTQDTILTFFKWL